jgi:hypothetical protein
MDVETTLPERSDSPLVRLEPVSLSHPLVDLGESPA